MPINWTNGESKLANYQTATVHGEPVERNTNTDETTQYVSTRRYGGTNFPIDSPEEVDTIIGNWLKAVIPATVQAENPDSQLDTGESDNGLQSEEH